jgi:hypothetical protein
VGVDEKLLRRSSPTLGDHHSALEVPALSPPTLRACQAVLLPKRFRGKPPNPFLPSPSKAARFYAHFPRLGVSACFGATYGRE